MRKTAWIIRHRRKIAVFLAALDDLLAEMREYDALTYGTEIVDSDVPGGYNITAADIGTSVAAVQAIANAINNRAAILYKIREYRE